jgi:Leucine-rich repeat (LRR) protein
MAWSFRQSLCILAALLSLVPLTALAAAPADVAAAKARIDAIKAGASCVTDAGGTLTAITIPDGSSITADDIALFGRLGDLETLRILNCRGLTDDMVASLAGLTKLRSLALTNTAITDEAVETIVESFPDLVELDLSSNTGLTGAAMKSISSLASLERLDLVQTRFNDLHTRRLKKLENLRVLDLRGNMQAGDMTLKIIGELPSLAAFKHRSTIVSDDGLENLAASKTLRSLLAQDFLISSESGKHLAAIPTLESLEIFRCQGFGSEGVLALAPLDKLERLTLRDLPEVDDAALAVLAELPNLRRLYLHELPSVGDAGLAHLAAAKNLEVLDIWALPRMTDAAVEVIAALPNLKELSIRETGVSEASLARIAAMQALVSLTFKNGDVAPTAAEKLSTKKWKKLDLGR